METPLETTKRDATHPRLLSGPECHQILAVVRNYACRAGMQREDCEDHAMNFLISLLSYLKRHPEVDTSLVLSPPLLAHAAANATKNALRAQIWRQRRESAWPSVALEEDEGEANLSLELPSNEPSPFEKVVQKDLRRRLQQAIFGARLTRSQRVLLAPLLSGERAVDIAHRTGRSPETIRHGLRTLRAHLCTHLRAHGLADADIATFLF